MRVTAPPVAELRCHRCRRLLAKFTRAAVAPQQWIEIKCGGCNEMNYLVGGDEPPDP